jgi:hypothetical protein
VEAVCEVVEEGHGDADDGAHHVLRENSGFDACFVHPAVFVVWCGVVGKGGICSGEWRPGVGFSVFAFVGEVRKSFRSHLQGEILEALLAVVFICSGDGIVSVDTFERGGACQRWTIGIFGRLSRGGIFGRAFANGFGYVVRI